MKKLIYIPILLTLLFITSCSQAKQVKACRIDNNKNLKTFNRVYKADEFYIYYSDLANSPDKLTQTADLNKNNIPDYVENIAIQAQASRDIFKYAGFQSPLQSKRYKGQTQVIAIFIKNLGGNGIAFEVPSIAAQIGTQEAMPCALIINLSTNLTDFPANYWTTVTHELFHLYEYGYAQFKNSWYTESLANWSERALRVDNTTGTRKLQALPQNSDQITAQIFQKNYTPLWRRLFYINNTDVLTIPTTLQKQTYVDGSLVFKDNEWRGASFILKFMQNMEKESDLITKQRNWPEYHWAEKDQRLPEWDPIIFGLIQKQLQQPQYDQPEIRFMRTVDLKTLKSE